MAAGLLAAPRVLGVPPRHRLDTASAQRPVDLPRERRPGRRHEARQLPGCRASCRACGCLLEIAEGARPPRAGRVPRIRGVAPDTPRSRVSRTTVVRSPSSAPAFARQWAVRRPD